MARVDDAVGLGGLLPGHAALDDGGQLSAGHEPQQIADVGPILGRDASKQQRVFRPEHPGARPDADVAHEIDDDVVLRMLTPAGAGHYARLIADCDISDAGADLIHRS